MNVDGARALAAAEQLPPNAGGDLAFLEHYCEPALAAVDQLYEWIEGSVSLPNAPNRRNRDGRE